MRDEGRGRRGKSEFGRRGQIWGYEESERLRRLSDALVLTNDQVSKEAGRARETPALSELIDKKARRARKRGREGRKGGERALSQRQALSRPRYTAAAAPALLPVRWEKEGRDFHKACGLRSKLGRDNDTAGGKKLENDQDPSIHPLLSLADLRLVPSPLPVSYWGVRASLVCFG